MIGETLSRDHDREHEYRRISERLRLHKQHMNPHFLPSYIQLINADSGGKNLLDAADQSTSQV